MNEISITAAPEQNLGWGCPKAPRPYPTSVFLKPQKLGVR